MRAAGVDLAAVVAERRGAVVSVVMEGDSRAVRGLEMRYIEIYLTSVAS